jgi:hypothetical protein
LNTQKNTFVLRLTLGLALMANVLGCATYADRTEKALASFRQGDIEFSAQEYMDEDVTGSSFLSGAEAGTVLFAAGRFEEARAAFEEAEVAVEDIESRALVSASDLGESLSSWVLNDTTMAYEGEGFERVYLHTFLGLCYLTEGRLQDVLVEVRRANELLEAEEELYERDYGAGGLGHFLSAITYETLGEPDEAFIDYRRMAQKGVGTELAGPAMVRIAKRLRRNDVLDELTARYGDIEPPPADAASIVVIAGVGLGPYKEERGITVETFNGLLQVAAPVFERRGQPVGNLRLVLDEGAGSIITTVVEAVHDVAEENLDDRVFKIAAKSIARTVAKRELTKKLEDDHGILGRIAGDIFNAATERADLRFWQTLPDTWQAARLFVAPGEHGLRLEAGPAGSLDLGRFHLEPGETMFVLARTVDYQLYAHAIGGAPVADFQGATP